MRNKSDAQPGRKLSENAWEALYKDYKERKDISVSALCEAAGVSKARFYAKFGDRIASEKGNAPGSSTATGH